ncbi:hypothetical protein [Dactylosporangium sp. CA-139066]|uniref:hypothetical protein n=1 Tax=Dactylosporangium sp. CA-139066 TaxID=3239930 RepID=UPI003D9232A1
MEFTLFSDYMQIELYDTACTAELADHWIGNDHVAPAGDAVAVMTGVNAPVVVTVEVLDAPPPPDADAFAHVTECSLESPSGRLRLTCPTYGDDDGDRFDVPAGWLRLRVSLTHEPFTEDPPAADPLPLRLQLWPAAGPQPPILVKGWDPTAGRMFP